MHETHETAEQLKNAVESWLNDHSWRGYDPFDGLHTPFARVMTQGCFKGLPGASLGRLGILQIVKRSPLNLRPFLRIVPQENPMSWAVGVLGALEGWRRKENDTLQKAKYRLEKMLALRDRQSGLWGYPFPWQARAFYVPAHSPNLVISAICLRALGESIQNLPDHSQVCHWKELYDNSIASLFEFFWRERASFSPYFSYVQHDSVLVHNANFLGSEVVLMAATLGISSALKRVSQAVAASETSLNEQGLSGRWSYGTLSHHQWADNFHTAYNLISLVRIRQAASFLVLHKLSKGAKESMVRGASYYLEKAFTPQGSCRYYDDQPWPIEAHSAAAALICLNELTQEEILAIREAKEKARLVMNALVKDLYLGKGEFAYRKWPRRKIKIVFARWTQAWVYLGLEAMMSLENRE